MQPFLLAIFLLGFVLMSTLGAWTRLAFEWPAYIVIGVGGLLSLSRLRKGFRFTPSGLCLLSAVLFAGYIGVRAWMSPVEYLARQDLLSLASCVVGYAVFALHVEHPKYRRWFVVAAAVLIVANFAIGVYQSQYDRTWSPYSWLGYARANGAANAGGFFHNENHLAGFLEGTAYLMAAFALFARIHIAARMGAIFVGILAAVTLLLTYSRGGMASAGVGLAVMGALSLWLYGKFLGPQFWKYLVAFGTLFVLLGGFVAYLCYDFLDRSYSGSGGIAGSKDMQFRTAYAHMAVQQWKTAPVWGTGARTYEVYAREFTTKPEDWNGAQSVDPNFTHNDYAQLLAEYGAVGLALGLLMLGAHLGNGLRFLTWYRNSRHDRTGDIFSNSLAMALGAVAALFALATHTIIDFNLHLPANALLVSALLGLLANPGFESDAARYFRIPGLKAALCFLAAAGAGWTLWLGWKTAPAEIAFEQGRSRTFVADYLGALPYHRRAAVKDPANYLNRFAFAEAFAGLAGEEEIPALSHSWRQKAIEQFRAALALYPQDAIIRVNLAEQLSLLGPGHEEEASQHYLEAIRRAPALVVFRGRYGYHLLRHGHPEKAADVWEDTFTRNWHGDEALVAGNFLKQIRDLQKRAAGQAVPPPSPASTPSQGATAEPNLSSFSDVPVIPAHTGPLPEEETPAAPDGPDNAPPAEEPAPQEPRSGEGLLSLPDPGKK